MTTRMRPMRPASSPLCSWVLPRVAEIWFLLCTWKPIGSAPNFSWSARVFAVAWVKFPVICGLPLVITALVVGAEITWPSSTIANWWRAPVSVYRRVVTAPKSFAPLLLKTMLTAHWPVTAPWLVATWPAEASAIVSPETSTGPRMYLVSCCPLSRELGSSQVMSGLSGSATFAPVSSALLQSKLANFAASSGVTHAGSLAFLGLVALSLGVSLGVGLAPGLAASVAVAPGVAPSLAEALAVGVGVAPAVLLLAASVCRDR